MNVPRLLKPIGLAVAVLMVALLIAGILAVPYRAMRSPEGYDQPRVHLNTKNTTRFTGDDLSAIAAQVSQAVYPATEEGNRPDMVVLYDPTDWQGALVATSLVRALNAVLLPTGAQAGAEIDRLQPKGSDAVGGEGVLTVGNAQAPAGFRSSKLDPGTIGDILSRTGNPPRHVIIVDPDDPGTALLAAPWSGWTGDLIVTSENDAPADLPRFALGQARADGAKRIMGSSPAETAVQFAKYEDPQTPLFGWAMNAESLTGYRAFTLARQDDPGVALLSANLARRGKPGPLLWSDREALPQVVDNYLWSQRAAFWMTPAEGPFHHFWVLGDTTSISFPAQAQADYAVEIGPYKVKGAGLAGFEMLGAAWVMLGLASALWIAFHAAKFLPWQNWVMRLAWPLLAMMIGPFGIPFYYLAHRRPIIQRGRMILWDRPFWLQGMVATASAVGFGGVVMVFTGFVLWLVGLPLIANHSALFWLGTPMILQMMISYVVAVLISWPLYQAPMVGMLHGISFGKALPMALPVVLVSMASVSLAMFPGMWWMMMWETPMMPTEESILWFGVMFFTVFLGFLISWPANYLFVRTQRKSGLM